MSDAAPTGPAAVLLQLKELWARQARGRKTLAVMIGLAIAGIVAYSTLVTSF